MSDMGEGYGPRCGCAARSAKAWDRPAGEGALVLALPETGWLRSTCRARCFPFQADARPGCVGAHVHAGRMVVSSV